MENITFDQDNFVQRRASQNGAGVAYDPDSLLTGAEIAQGLDYVDTRKFLSGLVRVWVVQGEIPFDTNHAPRQKDHLAELIPDQPASPWRLDQEEWNRQHGFGLEPASIIAPVYKRDAQAPTCPVSGRWNWDGVTDEF